jgi:hypothetical protein
VLVFIFTMILIIICYCYCNRIKVVVQTAVNQSEYGLFFGFSEKLLRSYFSKCWTSFVKIYFDIYCNKLNNNHQNEFHYTTNSTNTFSIKPTTRQSLSPLTINFDLSKKHTQYIFSFRNNFETKFGTIWRIQYESKCQN